MYQGSAQNNSNVLFVIIGMGISGLIIIDNKIIEGHDKYAEEFGFMLLNGQEQKFSELATAVAMSKRYSERKNLNFEKVSGEKIFEAL